MSEHIADGIKAVFFDHDDTLVGTIRAKWAQNQYVARTYYGKELTDDEIKLHWGKPLQKMLCLLFGTDDAEDAMAKNMATHEAFPKELFAATIPTLRHIKAAGKLIGIITATSRSSFEYDLTLHGVPRELVDYTQTANDTAYHKPDPRVFEPAVVWLAERQVEPNEVVYIGDSLYDMEAALGAGFAFLGVETGIVTAEQFAEQGANSIQNIGRLVGYS
jgi:beta-phosphoglucomutase-like phosphatase (HAD superfamily)